VALAVGGDWDALSARLDAPTEYLALQYRCFS
jgi:hypothetical protein